MKKIVLLFSITLSSLYAFAQIPVDTLHEAFTTTDCPAGHHTLSGWIVHNPIGSTYPQGSWTCSGTDGRYGTPGMECTGYYGGVYNLDTSYLITPLLDLSTYQRAFLHFDAKTDLWASGSRLTFLRVISDTTVLDTTGHLTTSADLSGGLSPIIGVGDSSDWVTHEIDITSYKDTHPLYFAFRYTSVSTYGSVWYIDNINITAFPMNVEEHELQTLSMHIIGNSSPDDILLSLSARQKDEYQLAVYDMMGRQVHTETLNTEEGSSRYHIRNLHLAPGMYFIKAGNGQSFGTVKTIIQ